MGSYFEVRLPAGTPGAVDLACRALDLIDALEAQLTVYRDDSEVSRLNATAHLGPVEVEPGLFRLLQDAVALSRETGGAYDVTSGALSEAWGFVKGPKRVPDAETLAEARARTGWHHLRLDPERRTVAFDREGIRINLGSIGKGYAIDRAVEVIRAHWWPTSALVHGGRSSLYALGSPPGRFGGRWEVALRNPFQPGIAPGRLLGCGTEAWGPRARRSSSSWRTAGLRPHPRPADRRAGPRAGQRDRPGPDGRRGRRPLDGLLSARVRRGRRLRRRPPRDRRGHRRARPGRCRAATVGLRPERIRFRRGAGTLR